MTRISEKVRDIVEVRPYTTVDDFLREPSATLANYYFSDATAYMMGRWLDAVAKSGSGEMCRAIAGHRGVGKSHFLAAFAVLMSHPELRSRVTETHVSSSTQQLLRRHYTVVNVRRGLHESLLEELAAGVCLAFDIARDKAGTSITELIETIVKRSGGLTPVLIIDSALERPGPVERNDGENLAEIAKACQDRGIFVGLALDDDIAAADGSNAGVSASYVIEYLDPEHLYKVVNTFIFPKNPRMQSVLGDLYNEFRASIPDFRWSEQRFSSLYPLHPVTLELAPYIRSYLPRFALFGFASAAGEKILGRPADSLIGVEEVFDAIEFELRKVSDLQGAFETYDRAASQITAEVPVFARHKAKLVLKVLLLNSLSQSGSTAEEIAATMMFAESEQPGGSLRDIDAMLSGFAVAFPASISVERPENGGARYKFNVGSDEFAKELNKKLSELPASATDNAFRLAVAERFPEMGGASSSNCEDVKVFTFWRGSRRSGRIVLAALSESENTSSGERFDWEVYLHLPGNSSKFETSTGVTSQIEWKAAVLTSDELRSLATHSVLSSDAELRNRFAEQHSVAALAVKTAVSAAIERVMVTDAHLVIDGFDYNFSDSARLQSGLPQMIGAMLEPLFEAIYPEHPYFVEPLTPEIVDRFVKGITESENRSPGQDTDVLSFGVPLGIVKDSAFGLSLISEEELMESPFGSVVIKAFDGTEKIDLNAIEARLGLSPVGLASDAAKMLLAAMAFRGLFDLVTFDGERIGGRSIDLKIDWTKVAGVASRKTVKASVEKLLKWARLITGDAAISSLADPDDRGKIIEVFVELSEQWAQRNPFEAFEKVPDSQLTTTVWQHSSRTWDAYTAMIALIDEALSGTVSLDDCLDRISAKFLDRPESFHDARLSVTAVENFVKSFPEVQRIADYLSLAQVTDDRDVEIARERLRAALIKASKNPTEQEHREAGYAWEKFARLYKEHYIEKHTLLAGAPNFRSLAEKFQGADRVSIFSKEYSRHVRALRRKFAAFRCDRDPTPYLEAAPFCRCGFEPSHLSLMDELAEEFRGIADRPGQSDIADQTIAQASKYANDSASIG